MDGLERKIFRLQQTVQLGNIEMFGMWDTDSFLVFLKCWDNIHWGEETRTRRLLDEELHRSFKVPFER